MKQTSWKLFSKPVGLLLTVYAVIIIITALSGLAFYLLLKSETHIRYMGIKNVMSEKIARSVWGMEISANNVFDEVERHMDSPDAVIKALESKARLNPEVRGYFAAFEPDFFPQKGTWFEPYVCQTDTVGKYEVRLVGSARHNYTKSDWYVQAKRKHDSFWSEPYYYYDGTNISGHYCTYVRPVFDAEGRLACVCGADMTFDWLAKGIKSIDAAVRSDKNLDLSFLSDNLDFYTVVLNKDGSSLAHPNGESLTVADNHALAALSHKKSGVVEMDVNGVPCTVYYGPIEYVDWSVAVVVPQQDDWKGMELVGLCLLVVAVMGMIVVWLVYRKTIYAEAD